MLLGRTRTYNYISFKHSDPQQLPYEAQSHCRHQRSEQPRHGPGFYAQGTRKLANDEKGCADTVASLTISCLAFLEEVGWNTTCAGAGPRRRLELVWALAALCKAIRELETAPQHRKGVLLTSKPAGCGRLTFRARIVETAYTARSNFRQGKNKVCLPCHSVRSFNSACNHVGTRTVHAEKVGFSSGLLHVGPCGGKRDHEDPGESCEKSPKSECLFAGRTPQYTKHAETCRQYIFRQLSPSSRCREQMLMRLCKVYLQRIRYCRSYLISH